MITDSISRVLFPNYRKLRRRKAALMNELKEGKGLEELAFGRLAELTRNTELSMSRSGAPLSGADLYFELYRMDEDACEKYMAAQGEAERLVGETNRLEAELGALQTRMERYELAVGSSLKRAGYAVVGALVITSLLAPVCQTYWNMRQNHPARAPNYPISNTYPITRL